MNSKSIIKKNMKVLVILILTILIIAYVFSIDYLKPDVKINILGLQFLLNSPKSTVFRLKICIFFILFLLLILTYEYIKLSITINKNSYEITKTKEIYQNELNNKNNLLDDITNTYTDLIKKSTQKCEFFYNICHELKTPLAVILGTIQLLEQKNSCLPSERRSSDKQLYILKQNCYRLLRLINNILDLNKIEQGYVNLNETKCNIVSLVEEITQSVVPYAQQKSLQMEFDTTEEEIFTCVDIDKIERILLNLLSNAIKFSNPKGKIKVHVYKKSTSFIIKVSDTGIGIPKDMINTIFERYQQVQSTVRTGIGGNGIGLSLVKLFVKLHNGNIHVNSTLNQGSEFLIEIPIRHCNVNQNKNTCQETNQKIIDSINVEFSDIYTVS
ncbi:UNVERIFIED_CONTAM: signal transduction histidine kinase [Acetivibrio alkalicellulosi]